MRRTTISPLSRLIIFPPGFRHCGKAQTDWRNMLPVRERGGETSQEKCLDILIKILKHKNMNNFGDIFFIFAKKEKKKIWRSETILVRGQIVGWWG